MACEVRIIQTVNKDTLQKVAEALGIPEADRDRVISAHVHIRTTPSPSPQRRPARTTPARRAPRRRQE